MKHMMALLTALAVTVSAYAGTPTQSALVKTNVHKTTQLAPDAFVDGVPMSHFKDYHAKINQHGTTYLLDSYVVVFEQPFYIHVRTNDGQAIDLNTAQTLATAYIEPRGCTEPLVRRTDLDKSDDNHTEWIIGVSC